VGSTVILIDEGGNELGTEAYPETDVAIRDVLFIHNPFAHGAVMMRKSVLDTVGVYDKRFVHNEDYDLWLRIAARHSVTNLPLPLLKRRVHDASITRSQELALARARIRTLAHAAVTYFQNPLRFLYLARPIGAYLYRLVKSVV
jgi:GT2 family glycosyltransferase